MSGVDATASKIDHRTVIKSLTLEGCNQVDIHRRMVAVYGDTCVSKPIVKRWARMFTEGRQETMDLPQPNQEQKVVADKLITNTDMPIKANQHLNIRGIANELHISNGNVHNIVSNILK
ncbi:hypothetical protein X975_25754, partial [Stegodyphus mimosarum]